MQMNSLARLDAWQVSCQEDLVLRWIRHLLGCKALKGAVRLWLVKALHSGVNMMAFAHSKSAVHAAAEALAIGLVV